MKTFANRLVLFAASALALGTIAWGQSSAMYAQIPFAFQTTHGWMPAGNYTLVNNMSNKTVGLKNRDLGETAVVLYRDLGSRNSNRAAVKFRCDDGCELVGIETPDYVISLFAHKSSRAKEIAILARPVAVANGN